MLSRRLSYALATLPRCRQLSTKIDPSKTGEEQDEGPLITDDFARLRESYATPKHPLVLAHGLLGFSQLSLHPLLPPISYWRGIRQALEANGSTVVTASVPPTSSIHDRATRLATAIQSSGASRVNVIAHSMGGLDARYVISRLRPAGVAVASLVTIATPHRGSALADRLVLGGYLPRAYRVLGKVGLGTEAFAQLTTDYLASEFNPVVVDDPAVRYFSFGADLGLRRRRRLSPLGMTHRFVEGVEGGNDGLVSVRSSRWGEYQGTLVGVSHLDLIGWTNRVQRTVGGWIGVNPSFDAVAFYLHVADMLAKKGF